jgi:hypothetical protein
MSFRATSLKVEIALLKMFPVIAPARVISRLVMDRFPTAREAKEFLVAGIVAEAQRENVSLSEIERKMLYFSETDWTLLDMMEVNDAFDRDYDQDKYENKIAHLIRNATKRTRKDSPEEFASWISAARKLKKEDHYLSVMLDHAGVSAGPVGGKRKVVVAAVILICAVVAMRIIPPRVGLGVPDLNRKFGSYTIDERLNNLVGYVVLCTMILVVCGLVVSHFDRKRRVYKLFDRLIEAAFMLVGLRTKVRSE